MKRPFDQSSLVPTRFGPRAIQRTSAEALFSAQHRGLPRSATPLAVAEELVARPGGEFHVRSAQRQTFQPPTGTFNFVRVQGETPRSRPIMVSSKLAHAQLAAGRPVVYAGTAKFDRGQMDWWSNFSGTYQPIAEFRAQAGLPEAKFVPWQKLQMGGVAMQRGTFTERSRAEAPAAVAMRPAMDPAGTGTDAKAVAQGPKASAWGREKRR